VSNEIVLYDSLSKDSKSLETFGMVLGKSGTFGFSRPEQGVTMLAICITEKITPLQFLRTYHVMPDGKFSKKAMAALVEFETLGGTFDWKKTGDEVFEKELDRYAECFFKFKTREILYRYSVADAKQEGTYKEGSRWTKRPGNMLRARVTTNALGIICPQIFSGMNEDDGEGIAAPELKLPAQPEKIVNVEVLPSAQPEPPIESEKELADAGLAPEVFKAAAVDGILTSETIVALQTVLGDKVAEATKYLASHKWFADGNMGTMTVGRAQRILDNPKGFLKAAKLL
jgi:hypothetical protein